MPSDKEAVYDVEIAPLVAQIFELCKKHQIPMVSTFEYSDRNFATTMVIGDEPSDPMRKVSVTIQRFLSGEPFTTPMLQRPIASC